MKATQLISRTKSPKPTSNVPTRENGCKEAQQVIQGSMDMRCPELTWAWDPNFFQGAEIEQLMNLASFKVGMLQKTC